MCTTNHSESFHHLEHISLLLSTSASLLWPHKILSLSQSNQNIIIGRKRLGIDYIHCDVYRVAKRRLFKCFECLVSAFPARICSQIVETRCRWCRWCIDREKMAIIHRNKTLKGCCRNSLIFQFAIKSNNPTWTVITTTVS